MSCLSLTSQSPLRPATAAGLIAERCSRSRLRRRWAQRCLPVRRMPNWPIVPCSSIRHRELPTRFPSSRRPSIGWNWAAADGLIWGQVVFRVCPVRFGWIPPERRCWAPVRCLISRGGRLARTTHVASSSYRKQVRSNTDTPPIGWKGSSSSVHGVRPVRSPSHFVPIDLPCLRGLLSTTSTSRASTLGY